MKREELVRYDGEWYDANIVDCLLDEKDAEITSLKAENERLKAKLESVQASAYADSVDAGMRERRLRRALYKTCANWADRTRLICSVFGSNAPKIRWERMYDKCLKKAEEYR